MARQFVVQLDNHPGELAQLAQDGGEFPERMQALAAMIGIGLEVPSSGTAALSLTVMPRRSAARAGQRA